MANPQPEPEQHSPLIDAFGKSLPIPAPKWIEPHVDFPHHEIDGEEAPDGTPESFTPEQWEQFGKALEKIIRWIYQDAGHHNFDGIQIRALIVAWLVVEELKPLTLTELARMYGREKQSFGRWVDDFKGQFPEIKNCHMQGVE